MFINTGRTVCSIPAELGRYPFDGYLCGCGTHLFFHDEELLAHSLPKERGRAILDMMLECDLGGIAEGPEDVYFPSRISRFDPLESSRRYFREKGMGIECSIERNEFIYDKLFVYADEKSDLKKFLDLSTRIWRRWIGEAMHTRWYRRGIQRRRHASLCWTGLE